MDDTAESLRLDRLNWQDVKELVPRKINSVILPVGTMEAHGATGLGTDSLLAEKISERMASKLNCLIAPTINYGITNTLLPYPGSITVTRDSFKNYVMDVMVGLTRVGFGRIVVMNGHGGQEEEMKELVTEFNKKTSAKVLLFQWWYFCDEARRKVFNDEIDGGHAGLEETAMMMGLCPEGVHPCRYSAELSARLYQGMKAVPAPGTILLPQGAAEPVFDSAKGKEFAELVVDELIRITKDIFERWDKFLGKKLIV